MIQHKEQKMRELPDEYTNLALSRCEFPESYKNGLPISFMFCWDDTPEGHNFWENVNQWTKGELKELPPIPGQINIWNLVAPFLPPPPTKDKK